MGGLIDLNTVEEDDETPSSGSSSSSDFSTPMVDFAASVSSPSSSSSSVCMELWHACAGRLISLPKKGSVVVYFPQGQLEHASDFPAVAYDFPPHIYCRVVDVKLHAEAVDDEVYAEASLVAERQIEQKLKEGGQAFGEGGTDGADKLAMPHMFRKTLTASDTSTHGGFSVPRRAAEDCFPPLDYKQQRPSQELVAKDLHGLEWTFRHIYRGQPRRHLLTTGWSAFINKKKLASGDSVLFLRGSDGELRLGIRRAAQVKSGPFFPSSFSQPSSLNNFASVVDAISKNGVFNVFYNPRESLSKFIVPFWSFKRSLEYSFHDGMRFQLCFDTDEAAERRYTGLVTGISDADPVRWPGSKWKCLSVRWDDVSIRQHTRVSPWEIEPCSLASGAGNLTLPSPKKTRICLPASQPSFLVPNRMGASGFFREPLSFQKVLQGQEILHVHASSNEADTREVHHPLDMRRDFSGISCAGIWFDRSVLFHHKALGQGPSTSPFSTPPYGGGLKCSPVYNGPGNGWSGPLHGYNGGPFKMGENLIPSCKSSCRLFGFPLTKEAGVPDPEVFTHP